MRYFVTGGTGFLGKHLVEALLARGDQVTALVRDPAKARPLEERGAELAVGDLTRPESMRAAMTGADGVFHLAGWYKIGSQDREAAYAINVDGTRNVLRLMDELAIPKGVYTSTLAVNSDTGGVKVDEDYHFRGSHLSLYDQTKAIAHHQVAEPMMARGLPLVIVLPGVIYGPGDTSAAGDSIRSFLKGDLPMLPRRTAVCWSHVEDAARGHLLAMDRGTSGESYIIAGPCHTFIDFFDTLAEVSGQNSPTLKAPPWLIKFLSVPMGLIEKVIPLPAAYSREGLRVIAGTTYLGNNEKARRELGYRPRPIRQGLAQSLPAYLEDNRSN